MQTRQEPPAGWDPTASPTFWVNHASRQIMRRFEERLRPLGFSVAYLKVAFVLEDRGRLQQKELLDVIQVEQPTMAALLKRMERDGLIERKLDPNDARAQLIGLTMRARSVLENAKAQMSLVVDRAITGISASDQEALVRALKIVVMNLADPAP